jgi:hypothetical protein
MRQWRGQGISEILDNYGEPVCPDCEHAMRIARGRVIVYGSGVAVTLNLNCPSCGLYILVDSQLGTAREGGQE